MPPESSAPITFAVPGQARSQETRGASGESPAATLPQFALGDVKQSIDLRPTRAAGSVETVEAVPGEDVVVMEIAGGPTLVLHPETARDLIRAQAGASRARGTGGAGDGVEVPFRLQWNAAGDGGGATRGGFGDVMVSAFHVVGNIFKKKAADLTAEKIVEHVDAQVVDGVYVLDPKALPVLKDKGTRLVPQKGSAAGPALVLLHGTFSSTQGTFQKLWANHPGHVDALFRYYQNRVYALDHATLGRSPIENAVTLVEALPPQSRLHLVSHSRGGLVAEVLARVCSNPAVDDHARQFFKGSEYQRQLDALAQLVSLVKKLDITVERVTRVACPVRGTLLASKRLDAYVSVLKWSLELAHIPVVPELVDFLGMVAQRRADVSIMPGLAAQIPDSPLVQWLHAAGDDIAGDLRVIAGDLAGDSVTSWLKTLVSDAFFWTDNDLVVQTRGMYGGSPRKSGATFLLDQGGGVSHFNYFANDRTADAIVNALTQAAPTGFRQIGPLSWAGESSTGLRGARVSPNAGEVRPSATDLPAVILVPDVLASHLRIGDRRVWLSRHTTGDFAELAYTDNQQTKVEPDGLLESAYAELSNYLGSTHEVIPFSYDWRLPVEQEARRLAGVIRAALAARGFEPGAKPDPKATPAVRIIAHGMGGLLARAVELEDADVWSLMLSHDEARVLLLGVPNGGSWAPMQVLSGDETFGGLLQGLAPPFRDQETRQLMAGFPGFLQLQAGLTDPSTQLSDVNTWHDLARKDLDRVDRETVWHREPTSVSSSAMPLQVAVYEWGVPPKEVLDAAVAFRRKLEEQAEKRLAQHGDKILTVVGTGRSTPDKYEEDNDKDKPFAYRDLVAGGDGYVTVQNALIPGLRAWAVAAEHRALTTNPDTFTPYVELLRSGTTKRLARVATGGAREALGAATYERSRPSRQRSAPPPAQMQDLLAAAPPPAPLGGTAAGPELPVTVVNGNLKFIHQPLMLGHYQSIALSGTEWVMDDLIGGTMSRLVSLRQYPDAPRTNQIFINKAANRENPWHLPKPEAVIVVGLGEEGKLSASDLTATVMHGVIAWAKQLVENSSDASPRFELAATLVGSGGLDVAPGQSALAIAQGVREANLRLLAENWPIVGHLYLIELFLDRATEAWRALQVQATAAAGQLRLTDTIKQGTGALRRPLDSGYRGADYDFVSATTEHDTNGQARISYRLDTKRARTEVRASAMQTKLLRELVQNASNDRDADPQIGRTLFQLLIPVEMEPFLGGTTSMVLEVDRGSAGIPWELLDSAVGTRDGGDTRPWAIRSKLLRRLRLEDFRSQVVDASADARVLVIGEPACDPAKYPRLPGAQAEARAVLQEFVGGSDPDRRARVLPEKTVTGLIAEGSRLGANARTIMNTVMEHEWRIVHIAGHGEPPQEDGDPRGVVLSNETFLGPREIERMRVVPELVFVNCCYLAARDINELLEPDPRTSFDRARFAAGVAEALIRIGVRCVIAAGWAVQDDAAQEFATVFYRRLLDGDRFIDAVASARSAAQALGGNTWAAYQCYGDQDWKFRWSTGDAQAVVEADTRAGPRPAAGTPRTSTSAARPLTSLPAEFASVASSAQLVLALETIAIRSKYDHLDAREQRMKIGYLEERFGPRWGHVGEVAQAFGRAFAEIGYRVKAVTWYDRAVNAPDGSATVRASEQLGNLRARVAEEQVRRAEARVRRIEQRGQPGDKAELDAAKNTLQAFIKRARHEVREALRLLGSLAERWPSSERLSLCGSGWKRRAMIERIAGNASAERNAIEQMRAWYAEAETKAVESNALDLYYPALNRMAADLILDGGTPGWAGFDQSALDRLHLNLDARKREDTDFWSVVSGIELLMYEAIARGQLESVRASLEKDFKDLRSRVQSLEYWDSVEVQHRLVLDQYVGRATASERAAAAGLREYVRQLVHGRSTPQSREVA